MTTISSFIDLADHIPMQGCQIGGSWTQTPVQITFDKSFDQPTQTCTVTFGAPLAQTPDNSTLVRVYQGYNGYFNNTFTGYVDDYRAGAFPNTWELVLRDVLKRAEDYFLDSIGVSYVSQQAETIISNLLSLCGLSVTAGTTSFTVGDIAPAEFKLTSVMEACQQVAALIGWKLWAGADGTVYFQYRKPRPSQAPVWTYQFGRNITQVSKYDVTDKDLRNRIEVMGYVDPTTGSPIRSVAYASSPFTTFYRTGTISSNLIDTQAMADTIAAWTLIDLNTLCYVYEFDCVGNPQIDVGSTILISDDVRNVHGNFMVFSFRSDLNGDTGEYTYHIQSVRWDNNTVVNYEVQPPAGSPPPPPVEPPLPIPGSIPQGRGNLLYVSTHRGLAKCVNAYGTDGTDGVPEWTNLSADKITATTGTVAQSGTTITGSGTLFLSEVNVGDRLVAVGIDGTVTVVTSDTQLTLDTSATVVSAATFTLFRPKTGLVSGTPGSLIIRWFNLDPFSVNGDHFQAGWAMTDSGFYRVTGLPNNPVWTQQLTLAQAVALFGSPRTVSNTVMAYCFTPNVRKPGFVMLMGIYSNGVNKTYLNPLWSYDYGATFQADVSKWVETPEPHNSIVQSAVDVSASTHLDDTYYISGDLVLVGNEDGTFSAPGVLSVKSTSLPHFVPAVGLTGGTARLQANPYSDPSGIVYSDDNREYYRKDENGTHGIYRTSNAMCYPSIPTWEYVAPSDWGNGGGSRFFWNMFDENYMVTWDTATTELLVSSDDCVTWTRKPTSSIGGRSLGRNYVFTIPCDKLSFFVVSSVYSGGGVGACYRTQDFGDTFIDCSAYGAAASLDSVMQLKSGDMDNATIFVDYYNVSGSVGINAGIDVSHYQGAMNWATAKGNGVTFAFIKATEGSSGAYDDAQFATNWAGALAQGIQRGAYHYFINNVDPTAQANHFIAVATSAGELGYAVDCEDEGSSLDPANLKTFLDRVETLTGQKCIIYTRASWWNSYVGSVAWAGDYDLWVAHWGVASPALPLGWSDFKFWQYSSIGVGSAYGAASSTIDLDIARSTT